MPYFIFAIVSVFLLSLSSPPFTSAENRNDETSNYLCDDPDLRQPFSKGWDPENSGSQKYMILSHVPEQLSKARLHFSEVLLIAQFLNRTLILPSVGRSTIGNSHRCQLPFCSYFDINAVGKYVKWVTEPYFYKEIWLKSKRSLTSVRVFVKAVDHPCHAMPQFRSTFLPLEEAINRANDVAPEFCESCDKKYWNVVFQKVKEGKIQNKDLLVMAKDSVGMCLSKENLTTSSSHLPYSRKLLKRVKQFGKDELGERYLAVQWRLEKLLEKHSEEDRIAACKNGLISTVRSIMKEYRLTHFFLAADMSPESRAKSTSLTHISGRVRTMVSNALKEVFNELKPVTWDTYDPEIPTIDSGISGILDKLTCIESTIFLHPSRECSGGPSSYVREIMSGRKHNGLSNETTLQWGFPSPESVS